MKDAVGVAAFLFAVAGGLFMIGVRYGRDQGKETLCAEQFKGIMIEGKCVARDSLKAVTP